MHVIAVSPLPYTYVTRSQFQTAETLEGYLSELNESLRHTFLTADTVDCYTYEKAMTANVYYLLAFVPFGYNSVFHFWSPTQRGNL